MSNGKPKILVRGSVSTLSAPWSDLRPGQWHRLLGL